VSDHSTTELDTLAPGLPAKKPRRTDTDIRAARRAERQVATMFGLSAVSTIAFVVCFVTIDIDDQMTIPLLSKGVSTLNFALGMTLGLSILFIGLGAIQWAKKLMPDVEVVQERHPLKSDPESTAEAIAIYQEGADASGFVHRRIVRRSLLAAMALLPIPAIVLLRDLGPLPGDSLRHTLWEEGMPIVTDPGLLKVKPEDVPIGGLVSAIPEILPEVEEETGTLNERAKAPIILVRMDPEEIRSQQGPDGENWGYEGILAFSKICPHVGCPTALYEQTTHHLLCPCHQSTFDLADGGRVVFGPAARSMPQLPITVDDEGYLVARQDFAEPIGPSFWERG
jgi:ubiquinol-cytochrome c reductase iron-sulfur subunit